ncbi:MAG: hypothetical protein KBC84_06925 [Proteobacteria bacterium]|nr:hypothetical protein [Pseudomonadota bacterium]
MGRKKKVPTVEDFPDLTELMVRCAMRDQHAITAVGVFVEGVLRGRFGKLLEIYFRGKESEIVSRGKSDLTHSQFYMGMVSAIKEIQLDLEQFVLDKDKLNEPVIEGDNLQS